MVLLQFTHTALITFIHRLKWRQENIFIHVTQVTLSGPEPGDIENMTGVLKIAIALVLFVCFCYFFGYPSVVKYLANKTAIGRSKKNVPFVPSPAITLLPHWKTMDFDTDNCTDTFDTAMEVFECLRNDSFSFRDIVVEESTHRKYC